MSIPGYGDLDPREVTTVQQFALLLRRLHVRAGKPSLRQLERWAKEQNAAGRREVWLTRSSVSDALSGKRLPRKDFVRWFTEACSVSAEQQGDWLKAWERVADRHFVSDPAIDLVSAKTASTWIEPHTNLAEGIQPVFVDLIVVTAFMKGRSVQRRVTERIVTAHEDGVAYYATKAFVGTPSAPKFSPIQALWGCEAELVDLSHPSWPATRLRFPAPLRVGDYAHFASEIIAENDNTERNWIDVYVDHHGIARGKTMYDGSLPTSGLTIRIRFDEGCLPEAVWWYENLRERERYGRPPDRDSRLLTVAGRDVQYTFIEGSGQPGENFGLAFTWPQADT